MNKRDVVIEALEFRAPPWVPWAWGPTEACGDRLREHLGTQDLSDFLDSHFVGIGAGVGHFEPAGRDLVRDAYGTVWDRSVDRDIGIPVQRPLARPEDLEGYQWPDAEALGWFDGAEATLARRRDLFSRYSIGFALYERAWSMRGTAELLMDMVERPEFVERLMDEIVEHNLQQVHRALKLGVDAVYFGDDYGMQTGLIMGVEHWRHFIKPGLARMFAPVRDAGRYVMMHSCGCVSDLFDDLVEIGLNCFNPFQPEVMDTAAIKRRYHGRLAFHGGMSIQRTLPYGSPDEVRAETARLLDLGRDGGYIFSPSHAVPGDVPPENLVAMMDVVRGQAALAGE